MGANWDGRGGESVGYDKIDSVSRIYPLALSNYQVPNLRWVCIFHHRTITACMHGHHYPILSYRVIVLLSSEKKIEYEDGKRLPISLSLSPNPCGIVRSS